MRYAYLHGFASGPQATKGQALRRAFAERGAALSLPDLNAPSFARLSMAKMIDAVTELDRDEGDDEGWRFVGSSLGGWVAARWAELHPERVDRLLLLCPAFDVPRRWPGLLGESAMARWARDGYLAIPNGAGVEEPVHHAFYEESFEHPAFPEVPCPTHVLHGTRDDRVPIASSREYAATRPHVTLEEVDDDHPMHASLPRVLSIALGWLSTPAP